MRVFVAVMKKLGFANKFCNWIKDPILPLCLAS